MDIEDLIEFIIRHEGFLTKPTDIGDGKITLGSGLTDPRWHKLYRLRGRWTDEDNRAAVRTEVENRMKWAETNIPNWNELPDSAKKALISYKYNYDFTARNSPRMYQALKERRWADAAKEINATSKNTVFKRGLEKRRKEEQDMFMKGFREELELDPTARAIIKGARTTLGSTPLKPQIPFQNYIFSPLDLTKSVIKHQAGGNIRRLPHQGDSWRNTNTGLTGKVKGFTTSEYIGDDFKIYPYTAPVIEYEGDSNLYEGLPLVGELNGPTVLGRLRTPADDLGKVMATSLSLPFLAYGAGSLASGIASSIAANPQLWAQALH